MIGNSLAQGLISGANIQDGTVDTPDIKDSAVTAAKIASAVITPGKLSTGAPTWDTSGNIGVGVTPSAWSTLGGAALEITQQGNGLSANPNALYYSANAYFASNSWRYAKTGYATQYYANSNAGSHVWNIAASGTAGNAITFTQAMTLQASGGLSLGTTNDPGAGNINLPNGKFIGWGGLDTLIYGDSSSNYIYFRTGGAEKARIDSSGNLLVGTTTAVEKITVTSGSIRTTSDNSCIVNGNDANLGFVKKGGYDGHLTVSSSSPMIFSRLNQSTITSSTVSSGTISEFARFDTSGRLMVGTTSQLINESTLSVSSSANTATIRTTGGSGSNAILCWNSGTTGTRALIGFFAGSLTNVGNIETNGTTVTYGTSSDYRLKEDIQPMTGALAKVAALKPCTYKWKIDGSDGEGFIAHELAEVCPSAVSGEKDGTRIEQYEISPAVPATFDEEGNQLTPAVEAVMGEREVPKYQGIDTSFLVATLTAAIQEQQAIIESLTERITALEAN